ncbi:MAG: hypothetical protein PHU21_01620, partial [Elusimicrobia bacterium]|nr:hypothetical protein [Elusimicrobiota bacterium]
SRGGTAADLSGATGLGHLIYKTAGGFGVIAAITGALKVNNGSDPTALGGMTAGYNAYWTSASEINQEQYTALLRGGTYSNLPGGNGGLLYKLNSTTLATTAALSGVLKGNGSSPPTGNATVDNLQEGATYKQFSPSNVAITGGAVRTPTLRLRSRSIGQLRLAASAIGVMYYCNDCSPTKVVDATGTVAGNYSDVNGGEFK